MNSVAAQSAPRCGESGGTLSLIAGTANHALGEAVASALRASVSPAQVQHFPDGEQHVELLIPRTGIHSRVTRGRDRASSPARVPA